MVNLVGISFDHRMTEDTGSSVADVARAFLAARSIVGSDVLWVEIDAIGELVPFEVQLDLFLDARRMAERAVGLDPSSSSAELRRAGDDRRVRPRASR